MKNLYMQIAVDQVADNALVLVTITGSEGLTPQKAGSSAIFNMAGLLAGYLAMQRLSMTNSRNW